MYLLDIGGGFPGSEDVKLKFEEVIYSRNTAILASSIFMYFKLKCLK